MNNKSKRKTKWWCTDLPLVSERVKIILSNPIDSKKLANSIRKHREGNNSKFALTYRTQEKLKEINEN